MNPLEFYASIVVAALTNASTAYMLLCAIWNVPMKLRRGLLCSAAMLLVTGAMLLVPNLRNSFFGTFLAMSSYFFIAFTQREWPVRRKLFCGFILFVISLLTDLGGSFMLMGLIGAEAFDLMRTSQSFAYAILGNTLPYLPVCLAALIIRAARRRQGASSDSMRSFFHILRPILLVIISVFMFGTLMSRIASQKTSDIFGEMVWIYLFVLLTLTVNATYLVQDIRYLAQIRRNETLEQQQRVSGALLADLRKLQHNIGNMLYGLEGIILTGDVGQINAYYDGIVRRCAMVNNENIVMLQNVNCPSVSALLLRQLELARRQEIPFHLFVEKDMRWRGLSQLTICQVLGVLIDNAREAALNSDVPFVAVEMRDEDGGLEIIVRNTFRKSGEERKPDFHSSDKQNHSGLGLKSVTELIEKQSKCHLNLRVTGQYVEAQIIWG